VVADSLTRIGSAALKDWLGRPQGLAISAMASCGMSANLMAMLGSDSDDSNDSDDSDDNNSGSDESSEDERDFNAVIVANQKENRVATSNRKW
jgi:hypothetical protein